MSERWRMWGGVRLVLEGSGSPSSGGTLRARWLGPGPQVPLCTPVTVATGGAGVQKNAELALVAAKHWPVLGAVGARGRIKKLRVTSPGCRPPCASGADPYHTDPIAAGSTVRQLTCSSGTYRECAVVHKGWRLGGGGRGRGWVVGWVGVGSLITRGRFLTVAGMGPCTTVVLVARWQW